MRQLVFLVVAVLECDKDSKVVCTRYYTDASASKLGTELIEASRSYTLLGAIDIECRDRWVVRGLLRKVRDFDNSVLAGGTCGTARRRR